MRSAQEMLELILETAKADERIRAVGMNGSRTNPNAAKDPFQDFDIVYVVTDVAAFVEDTRWVEVFGDRIIMQMPEAIELMPPRKDGTFAYLMLFTDGNRIDLTLIPVDRKETWNGDDKLSIVLLDKDNALPNLPEPTDEDYWVKRPTEKLFDNCCNEFWWVATYVAKGLWRNEPTYAYDHLTIIRQMLIQMLEWKIGIVTDFSTSVGKNGKHLERYLHENEWGRLVTTYPSLRADEMWEALFQMISLFEEVSEKVAKHFDYKQEIVDVENVKTYLLHIKKLFPEAKEIY
ncbi:aminoglycoside 6-adenylyltransferase [Alkalicoccobacillus porphyridii]|uniref:Aminoglycoside 6-adenylyltransferase n=1 Tax=Alkalicoccobacillus porphyridii TaxID=2597270 RepID=A0A553ZVG5_9BACI|nr:aminoglycoside 6-adenylyltransferase [Alkalicoccobacillus porphyridii]TSB45335.1 aminoglycoside 6-adenylyltransferase [Alkalicoccobacillus porphyridii]